MPTAAVLPIPRSLHVATLLLDEAGLTILAAAETADVRCPVCGQPADRVHSRYPRTLADLPWAGVAVRLRVRARRFFCANPTCPRAIFAERLAGIAPAFAHRTDRQREALEAIAFVAGGEAGARLAHELGMPVSPDTLLRLIRGAPEGAVPAPMVLGVDDWAYRKGRRYGTILVDLERHRPVDLLPDRTAEALAAWLASHPGVRLVSRDRSGAYAEGITAGAPAAGQVADRWHLLDNVRAAVQQALERHRARLPAFPVPSASAAADAAPPPSAPDRTPLGSYGRVSPRQERERQDARARRLDRYERVMALRERGWTVRRIAAEVGVSERTVNRWVAAGRFPERRRRVEARRLLVEHRPYLDRRWAEGCHTVARLCRELREQGYTGSCSLVYGYAAHLRTGIPPPEANPPPVPTAPPPAQPPSPREVAWLLLRAADRLAEPERRYLDALRQADPALATAVDLTRDFAAMVRGRQPDRLDDWLRAASASGIAEFQRLASGVDGDKAAVAAALAERWSNGQTEGQVLRLKLIKRQGYGRAKIDLLRKRVLRAA
jgi:transposase